jgi:alkylation response protein AidB-like acyl-CoA dehydrogenase
MGLNWVGPAIMRFGTPEQQSLHLPRISDGDVIWCQGFSEPEAGSDLAGLRTRAVPDGEGWRITGQKVWTSYALIADWCMLAARTSNEDRRQQGITLFMLPMDRAGITARPIESLLGPHHLNEVFFDDVYVGPDEVLGAVGDGWSVMRDALAYERVGIARYARCERLLSDFRHSKGEEWAEIGEEIKGNWIEALMNARTARLLAYRAIFQQQQNEISDATASRARIAVTQSDQQTADVLGEALGARLFDDGTVDDAPLQGAIEDHWRYSQAATVASGTLEVQLMLVARELLGTPSK